MQSLRQRWPQIWRATFPVFVGYVSVGFIFGVLVRDAGQGLLYALCSSFFILAGAAQFLLLNFIKAPTSLGSIFIAVFLLNLRHVFYYAPVKDKLPASGARALYGALALTDESFALLTGQQWDPESGFWICCFNQAYWILGSLLGVVFGGLWTEKIEGLDFALTALFIVLMVEKIQWPEDGWQLLFAVTITGIVWFLIPGDYFIVAAIIAILPLLRIHGVNRV